MSVSSRAWEIFTTLSDIDEDILLETYPTTPAVRLSPRRESGFSRFMSSGIVAAVLSVIASVSLITAIVLAGRLGDAPTPKPPVGTDTPTVSETRSETPPVSDTEPESESESVSEISPPDTLPETAVPEGSEGLAYRRLDSKSVAVAGLGSCTDREIVIPAFTPEGDHVISIDDGAFQNCRNITSVIIPDSILTIGMNAFEQCRNLRDITLGENVARIGFGAFYRCTPERVRITDIAAWCRIRFEDTMSNPLHASCKLYLNGALVKELILPETLSRIGDYAFFGCTQLVSVHMSGALTSIGVSAFDGCTQLRTVTLPEGLTSIGALAFQSTALTSLVIPDSVTRLGEAVFNQCKTLASVSLGKGITTLPEGLFFACSSLARVTWGEGITEIGPEAFRYCYALTELPLPAGVSVIGDRAFYRCTGLTDVRIPAAIETIGEGAFEDCGVLATFTLPGTVRSIKNHAFEDTSIRKLYITDLAAWCRIDFAAATSNPIGAASDVYVDGKILRDLTIPSEVRELQSFAFWGWAALRSVDLSGGVESIGQYAFSNCENLSELTFGEAVQTVHLGAFRTCTGLTRLTVRELAAFMRIRFYNVADNPLCVGATLYLRDEPVHRLTVPDGVTVLGSNTLRGYTALESVTLPASLMRLEDHALAQCERLSLIVFEGDRAAWEALEKGEAWDEDLPRGYTVRCSDDAP